MDAQVVRRGVGAHERSRRRGARNLLVAVAFASMVLAASMAFSSTTASAQTPTERVTVEIQVGIDGVVTASALTPVVVSLNSPLQRTVDVSMYWDTGGRELRVELSPTEPTELRFAVAVPSAEYLSVEVTVADAGREVGSAAVRPTIRSDATAVGIGASLVAGAPDEAATIAGIQTARLHALESLDAGDPGVLGALSSIALGGEDVEAVDEAQRDALRSWVWSGGTLLIDSARVEQLPVVDLPSSAGDTTEVGSGYVTFTGGALAAGEWSRTLAPSVLMTSLNPLGVDYWGNDLGGMGLIQLSFVPAWVVALAVFGTALIAGPGMWFLLRGGDRRRWMWVAAPAVSLLSAAALLVSGQSALTNATADAVGVVDTSPWGDRGAVGVGITSDEEITVEGGARILATEPPAVVHTEGTTQRVQLPLQRNTFGALMIASLQLSDRPELEVEATAIPADRGHAISVAVTNNSDTEIRNVTVSTAGLVFGAPDVAPGATATVTTTSEQVDLLGSIHPYRSTPEFELMGNDMSGRWSVALDGPGSLPRTSGLIAVVADRAGPAQIVGEQVQLDARLRSVTPLHFDQPDPSAVRVDAVGPDPWAVNSMIDEQSLTAEGIPVEREDESVAMTLRIMAPLGRDAGSCAVHTSVSAVEFWNGTSWVDAAPVGEPFSNPHMSGPDEFLGWSTPAIAPSGSLYVRLATTLPSPSSPLLVDCGANP